MAVIKIKISTRLPAAQVAEFLCEINRAFSSIEDDGAFSLISYDPEAPTLTDYGRLGRTLLAATIEPDQMVMMRTAGVPENVIYAARLALLCGKVET